MQRPFKLVRPGRALDQDAHEAAFVARLETLRAYARRHVGDQRALADDLLQDAFVHFTTARPDLTALLGVPPLVGRAFAHPEERPGVDSTPSSSVTICGSGGSAATRRSSAGSFDSTRRSIGSSA